MEHVQNQELDKDRGIPSIQNESFLKKNGLIILVLLLATFLLFNVYYKNGQTTHTTQKEDKHYGTGVDELPLNYNDANQVPDHYYRRNESNDSGRGGDSYNYYITNEGDQSTYNQSKNGQGYYQPNRNGLSELPERKLDQATSSNLNVGISLPKTAEEKKALEDKEKEKWERRRASAVAYEAGAVTRVTSSKEESDLFADLNMPSLNRELAMLEQLAGGAIPGTGSIQSSGNPLNHNQAFAKSVQDQIVETATAMPMGDLEYKVVQGKVIPCTLETAIDSSLPGMVRCVVSKDVYGEAGRTVLIPRGARVVGQYNSTIQNGQYRIFAVWARIITNTYDIAIGSPSTDNLGRAGSIGDVDSRFWDRVGNATLLSVLGAGAATYGNQDEGYTASNAYRQSLANSFAAQSNESLQQNISIPDTIHLDQGEKVKIMAAKDLDFNIVMKSQLR